MNWTRTSVALPLVGETVLAYWERDGRCEPAVRCNVSEFADAEYMTWRRSSCSLGDVRDWPDEPPTHWCYLELPS